MTKRFLSKNTIYKAKRGKVYDKTKPEYNCYIPTQSGSWYIVDCWICNKNGDVHPGYSVSPVPVYADNLGEIIGINRISNYEIKRSTTKSNC